MTSQQTGSSGATSRHIGVLQFDDVEELDAVGPWEVLAYWTRCHPQDGWTVSCLSADGGSVQCAKGLTVGAHHSFADAPLLDVLVHLGGKGTRPLLDASIDIALYLVQRLVGIDRAREVQRGIQFDHGPYPQL
jgi:transcriptional regulator GlxA family with amidase domain